MNNFCTSGKAKREGQICKLAGKTRLCGNLVEERKIIGCHFSPSETAGCGGILPCPSKTSTERELNPHAHAVIVPITKDGRLSAKTYLVETT